MTYLFNRMCVLACLMFAIQSIPCGAQTASETGTSIIQPKRISLSTSSRPISRLYVGIEPSNLLTVYAPKKTIFYESPPDAVGTFDTFQTTKAVFLTQSIKTTPLGTANLSEKAIGKDARKYPGWLWKGFVGTLGCSLIGFIVSVCSSRKKGPGFSTWQLVVIFGPLVPFLMLLIIFGFMGVVRSAVPDPKVDIYVDNATQNNYEIVFNRERVPLPPLSHVCLSVRPREHDLRIREPARGRETRYAVSASFKEGETYLINLEQANTYAVVHKSYTLN